MDANQFAQATVGTTEQRDVAARQVGNGFVLAGVRRFLDPDTAAVRLQQSFEAVAPDFDEAATAMGAFLADGHF